MSKGVLPPGLVIGTPVGFVDAEERIEAAADGCNIAYITVKGHRGGGTIAVATINALLHML